MDEKTFSMYWGPRSLMLGAVMETSTHRGYHKMRTSQKPASFECADISQGRIGPPTVSVTAPLLRPAMRDGKRVNSRSGSQAVHQAGGRAYQKAKGCASTGTRNFTGSRRKADVGCRLTIAW